jgi:hypothetical protein
MCKYLVTFIDNYLLLRHTYFFPSPAEEAERERQNGKKTQIYEYIQTLYRFFILHDRRWAAIYEYLQKVVKYGTHSFRIAPAVCT